MTVADGSVTKSASERIELAYRLAPIVGAVLIAIGLVTQYGQVKMTEGLHDEPAARATAVSYVQIVFSFALGFALFDEIPTPLTWVGAAFVTVGTLIVATAAREPAPTPAIDAPAE